MYGGGPSSVLPPGWVAANDPTSRRTYYYNVSTNTTQWEFPKGPKDVRGGGGGAGYSNWGGRNSHYDTRGEQALIAGLRNLTLDQNRRSDPIRTEDISLVSNIHGKERRLERNILRAELQAAIKYGCKENANPGRDGARRWRYTYNGVVYITDETSRHEITSWRIDGKDNSVAPAILELGGRGSHAVLIVDSSGSMRKNDVPGYASRAHAVYDCLAKDFAEAQVADGAAKDVVVTVISMSDDATVVLDKHPLDGSLATTLRQLGSRSPRSHGNYAPALEKALAIMAEDAKNRANLLLLFLSDGAPSDHTVALCKHGVNVWGIDHREFPLMEHAAKGQAWSCRKQVQTKMQQTCRERISAMGNLFGRDKVVVCTVAFGPPHEDFKVLKEMAEVLPRGSFFKLGLNASGLRTALSSLSSSLTELRTEGGSSGLTRRAVVVDKNQRHVEGHVIRGTDWWIYSHTHMIGKYLYSPSTKQLGKARLAEGATGLAFVPTPFEEGAERFVYRCTEICVPPDKYKTWWLDPSQRHQFEAMQATRSGLRLVAKEAKAEENMGLDFHQRFARVQADAAALAELFNRRVRGPCEWHVSFLPVSVYCLFDDNPYYTDSKIWVLVEPELDGKFVKWNNNAGAVMKSGAVVGDRENTNPNASSALGAIHSVIFEDDEDEDEDDAYGSSSAVDVEEVPQAFSHFTFEASQGKQLVCDIQGAWNSDDGFMLTDPVIHYVSSRDPRRKHRNGATDKGREGVTKFFNTHKCGPLCRRLGLTVPSGLHIP